MDSINVDRLYHLISITRESIKSNNPELTDLAIEELQKTIIELKTP